MFHDNRVYVTVGGDLWWGKHEAWLKCIDAAGSGDVTRTGQVWSYALQRHFSAGDYAGTPIPEGPGVVILNPEYGERMGKIEQLKTVYRGIGDFFKKKCQGYTGYIFTGNHDLAKKWD